MSMCVLGFAATVVAPGLGLDDAAQAPAEQSNAAAPSAATIPAYRQANRVAVLTVSGPIDGVTLRSLERRFEQAQNDGATAVVLDINTPGGELTATLDICHLLRTEAPANTIAWINPNAYSAGTIIALATREIVVQENASFGDAAPIQVMPWGLQQLAPTERAKLESPILEEVRDSARRNHYDEQLVEAFISVGVELWLLEHRETGERVFVDRAEYNEVFGSDPPAGLTSVAPQQDGNVRPLVTAADEGDDDAGADDEPAADAVDETAAAAEQLPPPRPRLTSADRDSYRLLRQVTASDRLLTVRPDDAKLYGLAAQIIRNDQELQAYFGAQTLERYNENWSEKLARFLMSVPVRAVLIIIFLVGLFIELSAPGTGLFGAAAAAALLLLLGAPALVGMAQWWGVLLVAVGLLLIGIELFLLPGLGVAGVLGLASLLVGLVGTFVTGGIDTVDGQGQLLTGLATTITAAFGAGVIIWLISRQLHSLPLVDRLILKSQLSTAQQAAGAAAIAAGIREEPAVAVGDVGVAHTGLRPAGRARFNDRILDVQSMGGFIEAGTPVRVVSVGRYVIEVEDASE